MAASPSTIRSTQVEEGGTSLRSGAGPRGPEGGSVRPRPGDAGRGPWRQRMATDEAKAIYRQRAATAECVNALARNRGLQRFGCAACGRSKRWCCGLPWLIT